MSIFPSYPTVKDQNDETLSLPTYTNIAIDFETGKPIIENGDFVKVEKDEAICVWCYYALKIAKNRFLAFGNNYGNNFEESLIGKNYNSDDRTIRRLVEECLLVNKYIKSVDKIEYSYSNCKLYMEITISTIYSDGEVIISV